MIPVVVHVADEHGVKSVQVSAEDSKLIQDLQLGLLSVSFAFSPYHLLLSHNLHCLLLQLLQGGQEVST